MRSCLLAVIFLLLVPLASIAGSPIEDMIDVPVPIRTDGGQYSIDQVRAAIIQGCQARRWTAEIAGDKLIRAKLNVRNKHFAVVEIPFSDSAYSVKYSSSTNLDHKPKRQTIHRNYNKWVLQLSTAINRQFHALSSAATSDTNHYRTDVEKAYIFDELLKLDDLRDRGILTDEEFETEKRKLLERN
ncbi:MAG: SHOCT domain-containing protein [Gammaproteobacteria bacterium]|nr:SHOCT domain-containing protein [Gammaproteobacteria bacterium]